MPSSVPPAPQIETAAGGDSGHIIEHERQNCDPSAHTVTMRSQETLGCSSLPRTGSVLQLATANLARDAIANLGGPPPSLDVATLGQARGGVHGGVSSLAGSPGSQIRLASRGDRPADDPWLGVL
jgi:hypothetical protein